MDMFMDKLAQKLTAQEMIQANMAADAEEMEKLKGKVNEYSGCLEQVQKLAEEGVLRLETAKTEGNAELLEALEKLQMQLAENKEQLEGLTRLQEKLAGKVAASDENVHKEGVKIYRNIQAVIVEENKKQVEEFRAALKEAREENAKEAAAAGKRHSGKLNAILVFSILAFLAALGSAASVVLQMLNYKLF